MEFKELVQYGIPIELIENFHQNKLFTLTSTQKEAVKAGLLDGKNLIISAPTSTGKTTIAELASIKAIQNGKRSIYLVTHKALAEEKYSYFKEIYDNVNDSWFEVSISTGDRQEGEWGSGLCVATYEKFLSLIATKNVKGFENIIVIADEIQTVGDRTRGADIELLCTILLYKNPYQIIGLTATIPNIDEIADWLCSEICNIKFRDVPLRQEIWSGGKVTYCNSGDSEVFTDEDLEILAQNTTIEVAQKMVSDGKKPVLVFCMTKRRVEELATECAGEIKGEPTLSTVGKQLDIFSEPTSLGSTLRNVASTRIAFHSADLTFSERNVIEKAIREGDIDIVFATPTLAAGINLPIQSVIFDQFQRWWTNPPWIPQSEYTNMSGRAGRLGFHDMGYSILIPQNRIEYLEAVKYISNQPEIIESVLLNSSIRKPVLQLLASGICDNIESLKIFFNSSLWFKQTADKNIKLAKKLEPYIKDSVSWLVEHELCIIAKDKVLATELGRSVSSTGLLPSTVVMILNTISSLKEIDVESCELALLHLICSSDEFSDRIGQRYLPFAYNERAEASAYKTIRSSSPFLNPDTIENQPKVDNAAYALSLWAKGEDEKTLLNEIRPIRYGQYFALSHDVAWVFDGICTILQCPAIDVESELITGLSLFSKRIRFGVVTDAIDIMEAASIYNVPGFGRQRAMILHKAGISLPNILLKTSIEVIVERVDSDNRANALMDAVANQFNKPMEYWLHRQQYYAKEKDADVRLIEELYSATGLDYEHSILKLLKRMDLKVDLFDTGNKQGAPDIILELPKGNIFIECKSRERRKGSPISTQDSFSILAKANNLSPYHCITIAKPGVCSHAKSKASSDGKLTIIEHNAIIQAYLAYFSRVIPHHRIIDWLLTPGMATLFHLH